MFNSKPPTPPRVRKGAGEHLRAAVIALTGGAAQVGSHREKSWASITFSGARHRLDLTFAGAEAMEAGEAFIAVLPDHEFAIPGQLVAEATVVEAEHRLDPPSLRVVCDLLLLNDL